MALERLAPLPREFYARDTIRVARALLGCVLESRVHRRRAAGRIVEVEAYIGEHDPADHGYGGRLTRRNAALFGPAGTAYVYRSYGVHWCFNAVTERTGRPTAVLVRALEPLVGLETMRRRRGVSDPRRWCSGPGRLCAALDITGGDDGKPLYRGAIRILGPPSAPGRIGVSARIGVSRAADWPLRFFVMGSGWLSRADR